MLIFRQALCIVLLSFVMKRHHFSFNMRLLGLAQKIGGFYRPTAGRRKLIELQYSQDQFDFSNSLFVGYKAYNFCDVHYYAKLGFITIIDPNLNDITFKSKRQFIERKYLKHTSVTENSATFIHFSGVIGFGIDDIDELEINLNKIYSLLKPGGCCLISYDSKHTQIPIDEYKRYLHLLFEVTLLSQIESFSIHKLQKRKL
jgi:hypothetical protein